MEECIICFDETIEFMYYNCSHKVCAKCYPKIKVCPMCKTPVEIVVIQPIRVQPIAVSVYTTYKMLCCISLCFMFGLLYIFIVVGFDIIH